MFLLVQHYYIQEILKLHSLQKNAESAFLLIASTFTSGKLQDSWISDSGFRQGLRQRSVSRESLGPRMVQITKWTKSLNRLPQN
jgi:hypothetical protein